MPGLKVVAPSDAYNAKGILKSAIRDNNPVLVFEHKMLYGSKGREAAGGFDLTCEVPLGDYVVPIGQAVVKRPGRDVTVVATHISLYRALAAAEELAGEGIECEVIDPLTLQPLDGETIFGSVRRTGRLVIVHEDTLTGGWGAEVAARAADECLSYLEAPVKRVATLDVPMPCAPILEDAVLPSTARVVGGGKTGHGVDNVAHAIRMPALGQSSDEMKLVQWFKSVGTHVDEGEPLFEAESDKTTLEVEAAATGTLLQVACQPGEIVASGTVIAWLGEPGEASPVDERGHLRGPVASQQSRGGRARGGRLPTGRVQATPAARTLAREHRVEL